MVHAGFQASLAARRRPLQRTKLAEAKRVCSCAVFLAKPRYRTLRKPKRFFTTWKGCSTFARTCALSFSNSWVNALIGPSGKALTLLRLAATYHVTFGQWAS